MANPDAGTDDERMVPPPAIAVTAARHQEAERAGGRLNREDAGIGASVIGGAVAIALALLSFVALWLTG